MNILGEYIENGGNIKELLSYVSHNKFANTERKDKQQLLNNYEIIKIILEELSLCSDTSFTQEISTCGNTYIDAHSDL